MQVFVIINNVLIKISVEVNVKNWLTKVNVIKNLLRILVIVNVSVIIISVKEAKYWFLSTILKWVKRQSNLVML